MKIGNFDFNSHKTFIIAELSANHNQSFDIAVQTLYAAKKAGADAIKLQTYTADTLTLNSQRDDFRIKGGTLWDGQTLYDLYKQAYTPWEWHKELFEIATSLEMECFSTPFDTTAVDFLETLNPPAYKIASYEITDYELIRYVAKQNKPLLISTGIATLEEIEDVISICHEENNHEIILLKCTSAYPAPLDQANLCMIHDMQHRFNLPIGFSDHTLGILAPSIAVSLGATVIEKHFILDKALGGADAGFSLDAQEFQAMVNAVRQTETMLGAVNYTLNEKTLDNRRFCRSLYASASIKKGTLFTQENLRSVRPGYGLHPKHFKTLLGKIARKDYDFGEPISLEELQNL